METETTRALVRRMYEAYARGDVERVAAIIHDDVDWVIHGPIELFAFQGARHGRAEVLDTLAAIARDYELKRYIPEVTIVEGDRAAVMSDVAFVQRATGRTLRFRLVNLLRFQDGQLIEFREFADTFDVAQQALGRWIEL